MEKSNSAKGKQQKSQDKKTEEKIIKGFNFNPNFTYELISQLKGITSRINLRYNIFDFSSVNQDMFSDETFLKLEGILKNEGFTNDDLVDLNELKNIESFLLGECTKLQKDVIKNKREISVILGNLDVVAREKQFLSEIKQNRERYNQLKRETQTASDRQESSVAIQHDSHSLNPQEQNSSITLPEKIGLLKTKVQIDKRNEAISFQEKLKKYRHVGEKDKDFTLSYYIVNDFNKTIVCIDSKGMIDSQTKAYSRDLEKFDSLSKSVEKVMNKTSINNVNDLDYLSSELGACERDIIRSQEEVLSELSWISSDIKKLEACKRLKSQDIPFLEILKKRQAILNKFAEKLKESSKKIQEIKNSKGTQIERLSSLVAKGKWLDSDGNEINYPNTEELNFRNNIKKLVDEVNKNINKTNDNQEESQMQ